MSTSISVKKLLSPEARPVSHIAAAAIVATSAFAVHHGAEVALPALAGPATAALLGFEWLQWTALGRLAAVEEAGDATRAAVLKGVSCGIGLLQVGLYTLSTIAIGRENGADWSTGWALALVIAGAAIYAALNFAVKYASCDPVVRRTTWPTGGSRQPTHTMLFGEPLPAETAPEVEPADWANDPKVVRFIQRMAANQGHEQAYEAARLKSGGLTAERARLTRKRVRQRAYRAAARAA
jgi:hypothetical protein